MSVNYKKYNSRLGPNEIYRILLNFIKQYRFAKDYRLAEMDLSQVCNLCNKPNDQMLMLKCVHDPCVNCAASTYAEQIHIKGQSNQMYVCEICGQQTLLDNTTIQQLSNLANTFVKSPSKYPSSRIPQSKTSRRYDFQTQPQSTSTKKTTYYCDDHREEQVTYYCFNCLQNICPQCAIHGNHKDHNVKMIKKAISEVKNQYMEKIGKVTSYQNAVVKGKQGFLRIIKSVNQRHVREKHIISKQFQAIRANLMTKEKQLLKDLDDINRQNVETLTAILEQVNKNYEESTKVKKAVELILRKDDVLVLQDFKKINEIEQIIQELNKQTQTIGSKVSALNSEYLIQDVKEIGQSIKKVRLKLEQEKVGLSDYLQYNLPNSGTRTSFDR